jgi:hypothetical protein
MVRPEFLEEARRLVAISEEVYEQYQALLRQATEKLTLSMELREDARSIMESEGATVAELKAVFHGGPQQG